MSFTKIDPLFPGYHQEISGKKLTEIVTHSLYKDFSSHTSTIKRIGQITKANPRTIKNWYAGLKTPSSLHFIKLVKASPTLQQWMLIYLFGEDFWDDYNLIHQIIQDEEHDDNSCSQEIPVPQSNVPANVPIKINQRQKWFLLQLKNAPEISAKEISDNFQVSHKTAKRDLADLKEKGRIKFKGATKNGHYELVS